MIKYFDKPVGIEIIKDTGNGESSREVIEWTFHNQTPSTFEGTYLITLGDFVVKDVAV